MRPFEIIDAATSIDELVLSLVLGTEDEFVIVEHRRPVANLVPPKSSKRIGIAKGKFEIPNEYPDISSRAQAMFEKDCSAHSDLGQ